MKKEYVHFSHASDDWSTPEWLYSVFMKAGFVDPCPLNCEDDAFSLWWSGDLFINPPYSGVSEWVDFGISHLRHDKFRSVWFLVPARTDTKWFRKVIDFGSDVVFITGRLKFGLSDNPAPFPSCLIRLNGSCTDCVWVDSKNLVSFLLENYSL